MSKSEKETPKLKTLTKEINAELADEYTVTTDDTLSINSITSTWEELNDLKTAIADQILNLTTHISQLVTNKDIISTVINKDKFEKMVQIFFQDVHEYSGVIRELRFKHENKTGKVNSIEDFELYNQLAFKYYNLSNEIVTILTPTMTEIITLTIGGKNITTNVNEPQKTDEAQLETQVEQLKVEV